MYTSKRRSSERSCVITSIVESPPSLASIADTFPSPDHSSSFKEILIDANSPERGHRRNYLDVPEDILSLSDYAFMMEMDETVRF
jgi:hypothetical protein